MHQTRANSAAATEDSDQSLFPLPFSVGFLSSYLLLLLLLLLIVSSHVRDETSLLYVLHSHLLLLFCLIALLFAGVQRPCEGTLFFFFYFLNKKIELLFLQMTDETQRFIRNNNSVTVITIRE